MTPAATVSLEDSYALCDKITADRAKNFHFAFSILPRERYKSICALYAFTRTADDLSDDESDPLKALENSRQWRETFDAALSGDTSRHPIMPAVADTFRKYDIPPLYMHELIAGTEMDARQKRYEKWSDTYLYCYRVASVIGMMTIRVFGYNGENALPLAEKMGIAFQMTNILRDLKEDAGRDRIYLPLEDLKSHGISEQTMLACQDSAPLRKLVEFETQRALALYEEGLPLIPMIVPESRDALGSLVAIYKRLLEEIKRREYDVFSSRVSLSKAEKLSLAAGLAWKKFLKFGS